MPPFHKNPMVHKLCSIINDSCQQLWAINGNSFFSVSRICSIWFKLIWSKDWVVDFLQLKFLMEYRKQASICFPFFLTAFISCLHFVLLIPGQTSVLTHQIDLWIKSFDWPDCRDFHSASPGPSFSNTG